MKRTAILSSILGLSLLTACGNTSDEGGEVNSSKNSPVTSQGKDIPSNSPTNIDTASAYLEVESIAIDGYIASTVFDLDNDGDTLIWGEQDVESADPKRIHVWSGGNHEPLSLDEMKMGSQSLSDSGKVIYNDTDWDQPVSERHAIKEYDPITKETATFTLNGDRDEILAGSRTNYSENPRMFIGIQDYKKDKIRPFVWNMDTNEITDIDLTETIRTETQEELSIYPHYALNQDQSKLVAVVFNVGIIAYDLQTKQAEWVYTTDNIFTNNEKAQSSILTTDDRYVLFYTEDADHGMLQMAFDLETKETFEIGKGITTYPLEDGNVMLITDEEEFHLFNMETKDLSTTFVPELGEDDRIDHYTVSGDGSTLAFVVRDKEDSSTLLIYQK